MTQSEMTQSDMTDRLNLIFQDVFDDDDIAVKRETTARDVAGWDSLKHLQLILAVERAFKVRLPSTKVSNLKNVGDLMDLIQSVR
jgi:acyl carrier protein